MNNATAIQDLRNRREQLLVQRRAIDKELDGLDGAINVLSQIEQAKKEEAQRRAEQSPYQSGPMNAAEEQPKAKPVDEPQPPEVDHGEATPER